MAKEKAVATSNSALSQIVSELFQVGIYKRTQGRMARQLTAISIWTVFALSFFRWVESGVSFFGSGTAYAPYVLYGVPGLILLAGIWFGYRIVNYPPFADFLIAVEAEMNKVSWPSQNQIIRSSIVVIVMILSLTVVVFGFDVLISILLSWVGVR